ncbi:MAG: pyruvate:ferredoxin (flavodoxin) oxidoreductase [Chloroflexi bacterium]|nr:pyruvate:ferredoxin (flavodoxin) oxidoreductase [Chloroflexota bacterium]
MARKHVAIDGNEAVALVAHRTNEVIAIYPITPSSPMGEHADEFSAFGQPNIWGTVPHVMELQSEAGAAGACHGALQAGALTTTFTASQGLLLMIPTMYKIAGELTPTVFHIAARSIATHALSIFGDHSDVMAALGTGWAMLFGASVQEAHDMALIAQAATLQSRVPFLNIMDGFRTSHEVHKIELLEDDDLRALIDDDLVRAHRARGMTPERPSLRGTAQNPDTFFQEREAANPFYAATPGIVQEAMDRFAAQVGREYHLFDYFGAPDAERVVVLMGSGAETVRETVDHLTGRGDKVGAVVVRLYRPFATEAFLAALPRTVRAIGVLDRTKEPGALGEPLYRDVVAAIHEGEFEGADGRPPRVVGGRYGLSSKEFTPSMVIGVYDELSKERPKNHFTVGIYDDVSHTSLPFDPDLDIERDDVFRAVFWGLGSDGTVSANKNSIKIIGDNTDNHAQGYFVYDSRKAGAFTVSHLRFGPRPIRSPYQIQKAKFVGVHQFGFLERFPIVEGAQEGATLLLNAPYETDQVWDHIPREVQEQIIAKRLQVYAINAYDVAAATGMGNRINTIMQTCFFHLSGILPSEQAIAEIKRAIVDTYGKRGQSVIDRNFSAVDAAVERLHEIPLPERAEGEITIPPPVPDEAPDYVRNIMGPLMTDQGDQLPSSAFPVDGVFPTATNRWEKRNVSLSVPVWEPQICIQCGRCVMYCPHAVIRSKVYDPALLEDAPEAFKHTEARWPRRAFQGMAYTVQVAVEDCTGCAVCVEVCPARDKSQVGIKAINMRPQMPIREQERENWSFFLGLPEAEAAAPIQYNNTKNVQLLQPMFEFPTACAGCGETPYIRLFSQLFGDRAIIGNATGCTSIYGANLPGTPWAVNDAGRGPAWNNPLFEDAAEFGLGLRLTVDKQQEYAAELLMGMKDYVGHELADGILNAEQYGEENIRAQRDRIEQLKERLEGYDHPQARELLTVADALLRKSVWAMGGDGWAYDIGYGGLDHVMATGRDVNVLVLDTEVYSNTGGQASKATGLAAVAKFAAGGKATPKKDLGLMMMSYGYVYVAQVAMGANDTHTIRAFQEAESYPGPSIIIAYSTCIAHGINMSKGMDQEKLAVESGHWPLYRYDPRRREEGLNPFQLDSKAPTVPLEQYLYNENRYRMLTQSNPEAAQRLLEAAQRAVLERWHKYEQMAQMDVDLGADTSEEAPPED